MRTLVVVRGSVDDGLGHVMRSRVAATALANLGPVRMLVLGDGTAEGLLAASSFEWATVAEEDAVAEGSSFEPDVVVFDLMRLEEPAFDALRRGRLAVSLSPIFDRLSGVDVLFHRTRKLGPAFPDGSSAVEVRAGLEYAVVGDRCRRIPEPVYREHLERSPLAVAVSMGGTDAANKTLEVLDRLRAVRTKLLLWVLLGEGYAHSYQELVDCVRDERHEIILAKTNDSMWRILSGCSLAVLAGGTTTFEAVRAGLPTVDTLETPEHLFLVEELLERGVAELAGTTFPESLDRLPDLVGQLESDRGRLLDMHRRSEGLIDGLAAERIAGEIHALFRARALEAIG